MISMMDNDLLRNKLLATAPVPHVPDKLPIKTFSFVDADIFKLESQAATAVGRYTGFLQNVPNPWLLLSPITTQEAVLSSKLEGTHATLEDILNHEAGNQTNIKDDEIHEIQNYRQALFFAIKNISIMGDLDKPSSKSPLTTKIIKEMHRILLSNVRGSSKHPGQFKIQQNYIGGAASISFTPLPPELTEEYMSNLERYIHYDDVSPLLQSAIMHAQFEMIHPFEDGNGRIGRLLIPLFFYYRSLIPVPTFYMSSYFEKNRDIYIQRLSNISRNNAWRPWIQFFLNGIIEQSRINTLKAEQILRLYDQYKGMSPDIKSYYFIPVLDFIFQHPLFTTPQLLSEDGFGAKQTMYNLLKKLCDAGIISIIPSARNKTYICRDLLSIIDYQ